MDTSRIDAAERYLREPRGPYAGRRIRFQTAAEKLYDLGLSDWDVLLDVGAGRCEMDLCLRQDHGWRGRYLPVDAWIDGVDLETWEPPRTYDWITCLEVLEHLHAPQRLAKALQVHATRGVIVTTPNPEVWDVLRMDPTHVTPISRETLETWGFCTQYGTFYGKYRDGIVGVWTPDGAPFRRPAPAR